MLQEHFCLAAKCAKTIFHVKIVKLCWLPADTEACTVLASSYGSCFRNPIQQKLSAIKLNAGQELHFCGIDWQMIVT